jgi:hypothetical protein
LRPALDAVLDACARVERAAADAPEREVLLPLARRMAELASTILARVDGTANVTIDLARSAPVGGMFIVIEDGVLDWLREGAAT